MFILYCEWESNCWMSENSNPYMKRFLNPQLCRTIQSAQFWISKRKSKWNYFFYGYIVEKWNVTCTFTSHVSKIPFSWRHDWSTYFSKWLTFKVNAFTSHSVPFRHPHHANDFNTTVIESELYFIHWLQVLACFIVSLLQVIFHSHPVDAVSHGLFFSLFLSVSSFLTSHILSVVRNILTPLTVTVSAGNVFGFSCSVVMLIEG